jgi:hypothetical protein
MKRANVVLAVALLAVPSSAMGQEVSRSFAELNQRRTLRAGDTLWVAYGAGNGDPVRDVKVELLNLSDSSLTGLADGTELVIDQASVRRIAHEQSGPLWNGALRGAAVGGAIGLLAFWGFTDWSETFQVVGVFGAAGAGIGIGIDALVKEQHVVYLDPRLASLHLRATPMISQDRKGVLFSVRW